MLSFSQCALGGETAVKPQRRSCLVAIISFLLSIVLLAALLLAIPVTLLRFVLTDHNIEVIVDRILDSVDIAKISIPTGNGTQNVAGAILEFTSEVEGLSFITEEQINEALLNDFVKQAATDILKQYGLSLTQGEELFRLNAEQIYAYVEANKDTLVQLARESGYEGDIPFEENKEVIVASIETAIGSEGIAVESLMGNSEDAQKLGDYLKKAQLIFSDSALYLVWGLVAFVALLLFFLNFKFLGCFCRGCGFPAFIAGGLYTLAAFSIDPLLAMIPINNGIVADLANFIGGFVAALLADIALPTAITGAVLILLSIFFGIFRRRS